MIISWKKGGGGGRDMQLIFYNNEACQWNATFYSNFKNIILWIIFSSINTIMWN